MPKAYTGKVIGKVGDKYAPGVIPPKGGNSPVIPPAPPGNRFAKGEIFGNSSYGGKEGRAHKKKH